MKEDLEQITARLNTETARIEWKELERHFARGVLLTVSPELDLVEVGAHMIHDDKHIIDACAKRDVVCQRILREDIKHSPAFESDNVTFSIDFKTIEDITTFWEAIKKQL